MEDFKVIETQEELDKIIQKRLAQKDREAAETYKDYLSPEKAKELKDSYDDKLKKSEEDFKALKDSLTKKDTEISDLTQRALNAESSLLKNKIAHEKGLPLELAGRLVGATQEELEKDAEALSSIIKPAHTAPLHTGDVRGSGSGTTDMAAYSGLLSALNEQMTN